MIGLACKRQFLRVLRPGQSAFRVYFRQLRGPFAVAKCWTEELRCADGAPKSGLPLLSEFKEGTICIVAEVSSFRDIYLVFADYTFLLLRVLLFQGKICESLYLSSLPLVREARCSEGERLLISSRVPAAVSGR